MADDPAATPLLSESLGIPKRPLLLSLGRWSLQALMLVIFLAFLGLILFMPADSSGIFNALLNATEETVFGLTGSVFLFTSGPVLVIALLAYLYVGKFSEEHHLKNASRFPRLRLWTFPFLVDGPFGVVSATEFIWIVLVGGYVLWAISAYAMRAPSYAKELSPFQTPLSSTALILEYMGECMAVIGMFCMGFLFLLVARGSILLRLVDISFEHAARYHVWLGHLTMMIFTLHGAFYVMSWAIQGDLLDKLLEWRSIGASNLAGVIALLSGFLMWVTSLHQVRQRYFELFFYTHQLYVVFILFVAMHIGDFGFAYIAGGIFLFILDRFLRFCQSRATVEVISASCLPCGTVELVLSKPPSLKYNAFSFIFLRVKELSRLQWHPFSVSSSPLNGDSHISILIKVLGGWTEKLRSIITFVPDKSSGVKPNSITASVEGPYGHEVAYHLMYENLILVAGGIGISPFVAVLSDILHRVEERRACLPKNILIVWAVKRSEELSLLSGVDWQTICPSFSTKLNLKIQAYVTQESQPSLEEGDVSSKDMKMGHPSFLTMSNGGKMSSLVGTGNSFWAGTYYTASLSGFVISFGLLQRFYTVPFGVTAWWYKGLLLLACMVGSVVVFGGVTISLWRRFERENHGCKETTHHVTETDSRKRTCLEATVESGNWVTNLMTTDYGRRPDFQDIFSVFSQTVGHVDVGVLACGPFGLKKNVARECRRQIISRKRDQPIFHFHSHSFDL